MEDYVIQVDNNRNIVFVGELSEFYKLQEELREFNKNKSVYTEYLNCQGFSVDRNKVKEDAYNIYVNYYHVYPIEARLRTVSLPERM